MSRSSARRPKPHRLFSRRGEFVRVSGELAGVLVESSDRPEKVDHVWLDIRAGDFGHLRISLSTCSRQSRAAGFDSRVWIGTVRSTWEALPAAGLFPGKPLNYAVIESTHPIDYVPYERPMLEALLIEKAGRAVCAEAWGELYVRTHAGVHQIHSRRASFAVPVDQIGQDGALQFYYQDSACEMLLFKFAGQP